MEKKEIYFGMSWRETLPIAAILIALFSLYQSHQSIELAKESIHKNEWPWFAVVQLSEEVPGYVRCPEE